MKKGAKVMENKLSWLGILGFCGFLGMGQPQLGVFLLFFFFFYFAKTPSDEMFRQHVHTAGLRALYTYLTASIVTILYLAWQNLGESPAAGFDLGDMTAPEPLATLQSDFVVTAFSWIFVITLSVFVFTLMYYTYREKKALEEPGMPLNKGGVFADLKGFVLDSPGWGAVTVNFLLQLLSLIPFFALSFLIPRGTMDGSVFYVVYAAAMSVLIILVFGELYPFTILGLRREGLKPGLLWGVPAIIIVCILRNLPFPALVPYSLTPQLAGLFFALAAVVILAFQTELMYRGLLLNILMEGWGHNRRGIWRALLFSSAIFSIFGALSYLATSKSLLVTLAMFSASFSVHLFFGALYLRSGNLWATAAARVCCDCFFLIVGFLTVEGYSFTNLTSQTAISPDAAVKEAACLALLLLIGLWLARGIKPRPPREVITENILTGPEVDAHAENPA